MLTTGQVAESADLASWIAAAQKGDGDAFGFVYDAHVDRVYRYVRVRVRSDSDAEELTESVFVRAWQAIGRYEDRGKPFIAWLYAIAGNVVADHFRAQRERAPLDPEMVDHSPDRDPVGLAERLSDRERIERAIGQLSDDQQRVVTLRFVEGLSPAEVGEVIGKREGTVRVIQHRALAALRVLLGDEGARL